MATSSISGMQENITALKMKLLNQKLANERERLHRPDSGDGEALTDENVKLHQAVLRRQELLDRLRREQSERDQLLRTSTPECRTPPLLIPTPPPSRRSLPDLSKQPDPPVVIVPEMPYRYVPDHQLSPRAYFLPPVQQAPPLPPHTSLSLLPPAPQPHQGGSSWGKGDFIEMMMMQNVQMHQMVMQQMMLSSLPGNKLPGPPAAAAPPAPPQQASQPVVQVAPLRERDEKGPPAVHHHHYSLPPSYRPQLLYRPPVHHYTLPPIDMRSRYFPDRNVSGKVARMKPKVQPKEVKRDQRPYPFPGNRHIRKLRHLFYAAWFIKILQALANKNKGTRPSTVFLFGLTLKEIVAALHRIYLNPEGALFPKIQGLISNNALDLTQLVRPRTGGNPEKVLLDEFQYVVEQIVFHITEIMPKTGVLGTHKKAGVFEMIMSGKRYPDGYFWKVEMDKLQFNESGRTVNVGDAEAYLLMTGIFFSRGLVSTILLNPEEYGVHTGTLSSTGEGNLKLLATVIMYLVRKVAVNPGAPPMDTPQKLTEFLFTDKDIRNILTKMKKTMDYAEVKANMFLWQLTAW
ncbi:LOW QUALITY PROTEIN: uncharacterized protein LOC135464640 [Liolophura sinensis]|uniref:LOW QUALITY PROTEIN: uncharacterized protein LOC135464640 n=1 Tax=Liolophura sinensis TaxID=3198878 RepID=UPI003158A588